MANNDTMEVLRVISQDAKVGETISFSSAMLNKSFTYSHTRLDEILHELENDLFINQYEKLSFYQFRLAITQKGLDAVKDESFI